MMSLLALVPVVLAVAGSSACLTPMVYGRASDTVVLGSSCETPYGNPYNNPYAYRSAYRYDPYPYYSAGPVPVGYPVGYGYGGVVVERGGYAGRGGYERGHDVDEGHGVVHHPGVVSAPRRPTVAAPVAAHGSAQRPAGHAHHR
jgi:hypothetical protein